LQHAPQRQQQQQVPQQQVAKQSARPKDASKRAAAAAAAAAGAAAGKPKPRSNTSNGAEGAQTKTMFYDMLAEQGVAAPSKAAAAAAAAGGGGGLQAAFLQDLRMERELARKLKVKKVRGGATGWQGISGMSFIAGPFLFCRADAAPQNPGRGPLGLGSVLQTSH
jgi:hypothetical protein